jgi:hypothetical protein
MKPTLRPILILTIGILTPQLCHANSGLPMIIIAWPFFWLALVPVICVEWIILKRKIQGVRPYRLLKITCWSNIVSTLFGIPLAWGLMLAIQALTPGGGGTYPSLSYFWRALFSVTIQTAWLISYDNHFVVPIALMVLMIPAYFLSSWIEAWITARALKKETVDVSYLKKAGPVLK